MSTKTAQKSLSDKIQDLDYQIDWFYGDEFALADASAKYKTALKLAADIEQDLKNLKNEIEIVDRDFTES